MSGDFADVYDKQVQNVYGFFAYRVGSRGDAEDLARNLLVDHYRGDASARHEPLEQVGEERLGSETPKPDLGIDPALGEALAALSPRDREVVALRFGADLTGPEIATLSSLSLANVQQILSRSLRRLRAALEETASR